MRRPRFHLLTCTTYASFTFYPSKIRERQFPLRTASAADDSSSAAGSLPAASVAAGAWCIAPHGYSDLELRVSHFGESDMSDLKKPLAASHSPTVPRSSRDLPNERTRDVRHSLFGSNDEYSDKFDCSSPRSTRAPSHERV